MSPSKTKFEEFYDSLCLRISLEESRNNRLKYLLEIAFDAGQSIIEAYSYDYEELYDE